MRQYPAQCLSMYCGKAGKCQGCQHEQLLKDFNQWVKDHAAICVDEIWSPTVYRATK